MKVGAPVEPPTSVPPYTHASTSPGFGTWDMAPSWLYVQWSCPAGAIQYDQYALADGVSVHGSSAGRGGCVPPCMPAPPTRQITPGPSRPAPAVANPASCSRSSPVVGVASQPRTTGPPHGPKSTATIAPLVGVHASRGSALAGAEARTAPVATASSATTAAPILRTGGGRLAVMRIWAALSG